MVSFEGFKVLGLLEEAEEVVLEKGIIILEFGYSLIEFLMIDTDCVGFSRGDSTASALGHFLW